MKLLRSNDLVTASSLEHIEGLVAIISEVIFPIIRNLFTQCLAGQQRIGRPVTDTHESYIFIASSQNDLEKWIQAINIIIYTVSTSRLRHGSKWHFDYFSMDFFFCHNPVKIAS